LGKWYLVNIPKILHVYFGGRLSYLSYLTIISFMRHNPDWEVMFYYPKVCTKHISWASFEQKYPSTFKDYFPEVMKLPISLIPIDFDQFGLSNSISEVHKSDYLRWHLLSTIGGLWSDMDILYFKPMNDLFINRPENWYAETIVSISGYGHSIGFLLGSYKNKYFETIHKMSFKAFNEKSYQCIGSALCNALFPTLRHIAGYPMDIGMDAVYLYNADNIDKIFKENYSIRNKKNTIGIHWYAGHPLAGKFLNRTNGGLTNLPVNTISQLLDEYGTKS
jgi:hypothetical protein